MRAAEVALGARYGGEWRLAEALARLRHAITFRAISMVARRARWRAGGNVAESGEAAWLSPEAGRGLALTGATRKLLARLEASAEKS